MLADPMSPDAVKHEVNVVPMNFRKDFIPVHGSPGEFKEVHKVDLVKRGSGHGDATPWKISALKQDRIIWPAVEPYYEHWLKGQEEPIEGTPIDACPFIPPSLVAHLKALLFRTAEELAKATDADLERIGMGARMWREKARLYVEAKGGDAKLADALAERDQENAQLRSEVDELRRQVNSLVGSAPRKRGRPPKKREAT